MTDSIRYRNSNLIGKTYRKLVLPEISARLCELIVALVDSLIAARWVGISAVSAIALVAPVLCFGECLHDFFVSGTTQVLIRYKSRGLVSEANRAFGTILADAFFWYLVIYGTSLFWMRDFLRLFTQDEALIQDAFLYYIPIAVGSPFCEAGLCLERGFKTDGRNGFFGVRAIITNILNVFFSIVAVQIFHGGILGISIASYVAGILGYGWSCSHFFSRKCTTRPDFSALRNHEEAYRYLKEERDIGSVYAMDDGLYAIAATLLNKAYLLTGGTAALAAVGIDESVTNILRYIDVSIQGSAFSLCGLFYADRDYRGATFSLHKAVFLEAGTGAVALILANLFSREIGILYNVQTDDVMSALRICLFFFTLITIGDCYTNLFSSFLLATERSRKAGIFAVAHNIMLIVSAFIGFAGISFAGFLLICVSNSSLIALAEAFLLAKSGKVLHEKNHAEIFSASYILSEDTCAGISEKVAEALASVPALSKPIPAKMALLAEECSRLILYVNRGCNREICADLRVTVDEKECVMMLIDTGEIFDPMRALKENELPEEYTFSRQLLLGFSSEATFARVVNLNVSHLIVPLEETR